MSDQAKEVLQQAIRALGVACDEESPPEITSRYCSIAENYAQEALRFFEAGQWQPIETAPKEGSVVLVFSGCIEIAWFDKARREWVSGEYEEALPCQPTHWMPLPAEP